MHPADFGMAVDVAIVQTGAEIIGHSVMMPANKSSTAKHWVRDQAFTELSEPSRVEVPTFDVLHLLQRLTASCNTIPVSIELHDRSVLGLELYSQILHAVFVDGSRAEVRVHQFGYRAGILCDLSVVRHADLSAIGGLAELHGICWARVALRKDHLGTIALSIHRLSLHVSGIDHLLAKRLPRSIWPIIHVSKLAARAILQKDLSSLLVSLGTVHRLHLA